MANVFRKETFYTMRNDDGEIKAVKVDGWTDGIFNYYERKDVGWWAIDPDTGLAVLKDVAFSKKDARHEALEIKDKFDKYKDTKDYQNCVLNFYNAKVKAGSYVFLNNTKG